MSAEIWPAYITAIGGIAFSIIGIIIAMMTRRDAARKAELIAAEQKTKEAILEARDKSRSEFTALRETIQELRAENKRLSERVAGLEEENRELRGMIDEDQNQIAMLKKAKNENHPR